MERKNERDREKEKKGGHPELVCLCAAFNLE